MKIYLSLLLLCFPLTLATEAALQEFTSGNNLFTSSVYKEILKTENGNFLVSPLSAETVLALTHSGAKDATAEELRTALHLPQSQAKIESAIRSLKPKLRQSGLYTLQSANKIYVKKDFAIRNDFKKVAADVFGSELENIDFNATESAAAKMNEWVEGRTEHKIQNLISPDVLNSRTRAILINALYFKGNWSISFPKYATFQDDFYKKGTELVQTDVMHDTENRNYYESKELDAKFLELPFDGGDITLTVVLPNEKNGLAALEKQIEKVVQTPKYSTEYVRVWLPKFKITNEVDFTKLLQGLGVNKIFKDEEADLSGIAGEKGDLVVSKVLQKAFIDVNEEGVEAAAATYAAVGVPLSGIVNLTPPKEFKADHPFIFILKDKDLVLFAGRVVDPTVK